MGAERVWLRAVGTLEGRGGHVFSGHGSFGHPGGEWGGPSSRLLGMQGTFQKNSERLGSVITWEDPIAASPLTTSQE